MEETAPKRLWRRWQDKRMFSGVCAAIAYRTGLSVWNLRMVIGFFALCYGIGIALYIALWALIPAAPKAPPDYEERIYDPDDDSVI